MTVFDSAKLLFSNLIDQLMWVFKIFFGLFLFFTAEDKTPTLMLDTTLYRRDSMDNETDWKEYFSAKVERSLDCTIGHEEVGVVCT